MCHGVECIESLKKLRRTPSVRSLLAHALFCIVAKVFLTTLQVVQEYEAIYLGASDEARRDSRWRSLLFEYPFRYVVNLGVMLQCMFVLGGLQVFLLQGQIFLRLCGLYQLPSPVIAAHCSPVYEVLERVVVSPAAGRPDDSYASPTMSAPTLPFTAGELSAGYDDLFSLGGLGCGLFLIACVLGTFAGKMID